MNLKVIAQRNKDRINRLRRVQRLIESQAFSSAWYLTSSGVRSTIEAWIYLGNADQIEQWLKTTLEQELDSMNLRQLRNMARRLAVPYYSQYSKDELIFEVYNALDRTEYTEDSRDQRRDAKICQNSQVESTPI